MRTSSGSFSMRTNIVGTHWLWVAEYFSIACSALAGSNFSMMTNVPPIRWTGMEKAKGAAWYIGAGER